MRIPQIPRSIYYENSLLAIICQCCEHIQQAIPMTMAVRWSPNFRRLVPCCWILPRNFGQVKKKIAKGCLAKRQSPVFLPDDPTKSPFRTRLAPYAQPIVYAHAWHLYYAGTGVPSHPPCPVHG